MEATALLLNTHGLDAYGSPAAPMPAAKAARMDCHVVAALDRREPGLIFKSTRSLAFVVIRDVASTTVGAFKCTVGRTAHNRYNPSNTTTFWNNE